MVSTEAAGARLDTFLASLIIEVSRTRIQRAIEDGDILVNDRAVKPSYRLRAGDEV
jgi:23S rRNA pseudouridine1911/1915/1917 synthase